jgi:mRNA interferase RelE/StbE
LTAEVLYKASVAKDLKKVNPNDKQRILGQIEETLSGDPRSGEALHGEFEGLFKLRIGDYRVIFALAGEDVLILRIRHRALPTGKCPQR